MQNLRDKLLKAGIVSERQAKEAERDQRAGRQRRHREREQAVSAEEEQRREGLAAGEAELAEERRKEAAKKAEARMQSERAHRLRQLVDTHRIREAPGEVNFHFVKRSGKVGRLALSAETAKMLESGAAAVGEDPGAAEHAVVPAAPPKRIHEVGAQAVRFWFGPAKPVRVSHAG